MKKKTAKKILLTGSSGLLGLGLLQTKPQDVALTGTYNNDRLPLNHFKENFQKIDLTDGESIQRLIKSANFDVIIHTMSAGNVDFCEKNKHIARLMNIEVTRNLINCLMNGKDSLPLFVFISSNAVFSGIHPPYAETAAVDPINYYGETKVEAEKIITSSGIPYLIIRPVLMIGWNSPRERENPATWILSSLKNEKQISLVNDVYNNPILNTEVAKLIWKAISLDKTGVFHVGGSNRVSRYQLGVCVADVFKKNRSFIKEVDSSFFPLITPRMHDTTFSTELAESVLGFEPMSVQEYLNQMSRNRPPWEYI